MSPELPDKEESHRFLKACRRQAVDCTPVWIMRQAGRYLPEYREIRRKHSFLTTCKTPDLCTEVTLQPLKRFDLDAAIIFSDILIPLEPMGIEIDFPGNGGPVIGNPIRTGDDVKALREVEPAEAFPFVIDAIRQTRRALDGRKPLIGFSGAPFTLASYIIDGGGSKNYLLTKTLMYEDRATWTLLMEKLSRTVMGFLRGQIEAGAQAVQIFDSWVGCLSPDDYREYVLPFSSSIVEGLRDTGVPIIHFGTRCSGLLEIFREIGSDVIGVDWRTDLDVAWERIGHDRAIQGNLDPVTLFATPEILEDRIGRVIDRAASRAGHIFNLGHGILPTTPIENVERLIHTVHERTRRSL